MKSLFVPLFALVVVACGDDGGGPSDGGRRDGAVSIDGGRDATVSTDARLGDASTPPDAPSACGDGLCALDEDATSCCSDCGVCTEGAVVRMETGGLGGAPGTGVTPGGMADTHAYFAGGPFAELVFPFTVVEEPVADSSYFWAQQFFFEGTTEGGYTGVQTNGIIGGATVGKMIIFSIWEALAAEAGDAEATCQTFGGEGIGYSCRLPFDWRVNVTYRLTLREVAADRWSLTLSDPTTAEERVLGTITLIDTWGRVRTTTAGFAEYYGEVASCDTMPHTIALLHQPVADGAAPMSVDAGVYGMCAAQSMSTCTGALCM